MSGDEVRRFRRKEEQRADQFLGASNPAHWGHLSRPFEKRRYGKHAGSHLAQKPARRERVHSHASVCPTAAKFRFPSSLIWQMECDRTVALLYPPAERLSSDSDSSRGHARANLQQRTRPVSEPYDEMGAVDYR